ncbi:MAG: hypothetical protein ACLPN1_06065 [Dissulfurispiraceae bacterium]|jgi:hypothetical protein
MKPKHLLFCLLTLAVLLPSFVSASNWLLFASTRQPEANWFYDRENIVYSRAKSFASVEIPLKDRNYPRLWIKSVRDRVGTAYQVELNCKERTARLQDDSGKTLYSISSINYLYDVQIVPDSVLDMLRKTICH